MLFEIDNLARDHVIFRMDDEKIISEIKCDKQSQIFCIQSAYAGDDLTTAKIFSLAL